MMTLIIAGLGFTFIIGLWTGVVTQHFSILKAMEMEGQ